MFSCTRWYFIGFWPLGPTELVVTCEVCNKRLRHIRGLLHGWNSSRPWRKFTAARYLIVCRAGWCTNWRCRSYPLGGTNRWSSNAYCSLRPESAEWNTNEIRNVQSCAKIRKWPRTIKLEQVVCLVSCDMIYSRTREISDSVISDNRIYRINF